MAQRGHVPRRMCAGCGKRFAKAALVRFTVRETPEGRALMLGEVSGNGGRGGYVCASFDCFDQALARKTLVRRLKASMEDGNLREEFARLIESR